METFIRSCSISNTPFLTFPVQPRSSCFVLQAVVCQFDCYGHTFAASHLRVGHYPLTSLGYFADEMDDNLKTGRHSLSEKWQKPRTFYVARIRRREKRRPSSGRCVLNAFTRTHFWKSQTFSNINFLQVTTNATFAADRGTFSWPACCDDRLQSCFTSNTNWWKSWSDISSTAFRGSGNSSHGLNSFSQTLMMFYMAPHRSAEQPDLIKMVIKYLGLYLLAPTAPWDFWHSVRSSHFRCRC